MNNTWSSEGIHITPHVCVDVKAGPDGVVLGHLHDDVYAADTTLSPTQARAIADALIRGANECLKAGGKS